MDREYRLRVPEESAETIEMLINHMPKWQIISSEKAQAYERPAPELVTPDGRHCSPVFTEEGYAVYMVAAVAAATGLSSDRISELIKKGRLRAVKPGTDWLVSLTDVLNHKNKAKHGRPRKNPT